MSTTATGRRALFACLVLVTALGALDQTIVATALPAIVTELGAPTRVSWVVTAYALALTAAMPAAGALGDRFGHRRVLALSIGVFVISSGACGLAGNVEFLAAARLAQGLGGAGLLVLPQAVVAGAVPARERTAFLGPLGAVYAVATVAGPLLGGWLTDLASWRWIFWLNLPLGAAAAALVLAAVPAGRRPDAQARFDTTGAVLLAAAANGLVLVTTAVAETGWHAATVTAAAGTAVVAAAALAWERRAADPVLPVTLARDRTVLLCCLLALAGGIGLFGVLAYVPTWVQEVYRTSATTGGLLLLPVTAGIVAGVNASGFAVRRWGAWRPFPVAGCALSGGAAAALASIGEAPLPVVAALLALLGLGTGLFMQIVVVVAQDAGGARRAGAVTAGLAFVREAGVTVGAAVLGALGARAAGGSYAPVFATAAMCFAAGFACALALPDRRLESK
ncbi:MFS transporter [Amycolatopsis thermalba]|uniref:MFS transporter n=1 Tax=Amycolatopsis thermalba TaxID=944492 RepID=UPI0013BEA834|nr:MFS transporter [Amycolatopsis thermalba]